MVGAIRNASWFAYFPDDYRWSYNLLIVLAMARTGGCDIGEVDQVGRRLKESVGNDEAWFREWVAMGDHVSELAEEAQSAGHRRSAAAHYRRACMYYLAGERFRLPKDAKALDAYQRCLECFRQVAEASDRAVEFVDIPYEGKSLPAHFVPAHNPTSERPPVVVFFNGFDGNKELSWFLGIEELTARGLACLSVDSPGVGEAIRFRDIYLRHDYEVAGSAALDYLATRDDVDVDRVGIMALSLGGYYASRSASLEPRFKACVAWGAIWDYHAIWRRRVELAYQSQLPVPGEHVMWSTDTKTLDDALVALEGFRLDGVVQQMRCPFLLSHGEDDQQVSLDDAQSLFEAVGSEDKTFEVYRGVDGGAQHCHMDNLSVATPRMFDWLADRLEA